VHAWKIKSDVKYLRKFVYQRDLGMCASCGIDTRYVRIELEDAAKKSMVASGVWYWLDNPIYLEVCRKYHLTPKQSMNTLWNADHKLEVADGGGECDLSNIQTLCLNCHHKKSAATAARRRAAKVADVIQLNVTTF
jgi:5-methylcytosine-specific restriction endonuclease McrA